MLYCKLFASYFLVTLNIFYVIVFTSLWFVFFVMQPLTTGLSTSMDLHPMMIMFSSVSTSPVLYS